jgi:DNA-binding MarR family transcriptional regulator
MVVSEPGGAPPQSDVAALTDVVARLRRALRSSIRTDYPYESLPIAQVELMQALGDVPSLRIGDLASQLRLAANTVSGLASQLIDAGLVSRHADPADRRAGLLTLTAAGRQKLTDWQSAHERRIGAALATLAEQDRAAITAAIPALARLVATL